MNMMTHTNTIVRFNPFPAKFSYLNFLPLEVMSRHRDPQLQVGWKLIIFVYFKIKHLQTLISFIITVFDRLIKQIKNDHSGAYRWKSYIHFIIFHLHFIMFVRFINEEPIIDNVG